MPTLQPIPKKRYSSYAEFDAEVDFASRAGWQLSDLQQQDANTFLGWQVFLNRYEVGGGKTVLGTVVSYMKGMDVTIVAVPPILIVPWTRWLQQVHGNTGIVQYKGEPKLRKVMKPVLRTARWIICSHQIFLRERKVLEEAIMGRDYEIVVDEGHALKNIASKLYIQTAQMMAGMDGQILTATPINKPEDSFAYISLKTPELYRGWAHWEAIHVTKKDFISKKPVEYANIKLMKDNFALRSILRTKEELHGYNNVPLTPDCHYALEPKHYALYQKLIDEALLELPNGSKIDASTAQKMYHASQQIIMNLDFYSGVEGSRTAGHDLLDLTIEQTECNMVDKSKLLVWTYYKMTSRSVWKYLLAKGIKTVAAYSEVNSARSVEQFMFDDSVRIGVFQPSSAGAGLNPQAVCWESIAMEISTNATLKIQSGGRIDRMGQKHKPSIRTGVAVGTVQVALFERLLTNGDMIAAVEGSPKRLRDILMGCPIADL